MKSWLRDGVAALLRYSAHTRVDAERRVVVLVYHSVHPNGSHSNTVPELFRLHLAWLQENCEVVPLRGIAAAWASEPQARPRVAITFDDGFAATYDHALPALVEYDIPATFFLTTGLLNGGERVLERFSRLLSADREVVLGLTWSQVGEFLDQGMNIGAHTVTHPNLATLAPSAARTEIESGKLELEDRLGIEVTEFAYPFGKPKHHFTAATVQAVRQSGLEMAVAVHHRGVRPSDGPFRIPRFAADGDDIRSLRRKVFGDSDGFGVWQEISPRWLSHAVSPSRSHYEEASLLPES